MYFCIRSCLNLYRQYLKKNGETNDTASIRKYFLEIHTASKIN